MMTDSQFVKSFSKMIAFLVVITVIFITMGIVIGGSIDDKLRAQSEEYTQRVISQRTQPVGKLNVGAIPPSTEDETPVQLAAVQSPSASMSAEAASDAHPGEAVYRKACYICHDVGLTGAPKPGDAENWNPRIEKGIEVLYSSAIGGFQGQRGIMPPKGGNSLLTDEEVKASVDYLVNLVQ